MEWQDCTVKMEVDIPASAAYNFYSDRESFPRWMPFISSVKVLEDKSDLSKWSLKYNAFGQDIEYSWLARNMLGSCSVLSKGCLFEGDVIRRASQGLEISFGIFKNQLTVSYEVPQLLVPVACTATCSGRIAETRFRAVRNTC